MSDILIRGMEMPTDGHWGTVSIPFYIHGDGSVSDSKGHIIGSVVPVPPHGRLVDTAVLWVEVNKICDRRDAGIITDLTCLQQILSALRHAPTIIPAEPFNNLSKPCKEEAAP